MSDKLYLEDLAGLSEQEVKEHISEQYAGNVSGFDYGYPSDEEKLELLNELNNYEILIAYESVGSWGCDSASYFLMKKKDGTYWEFDGSHCSCYGFEGQYEPQEATKEYLNSDRFSFCCGGYDDNSSENQRKIKEYAKNI